MKGETESQPNDPPRLGYSVAEFCRAVGISISHLYELRTAGRAPRTMAGLGTRQIISIDEARRWCAERTEAGNQTEAPAAAGAESQDAISGAQERVQNTHPLQGDAKCPMEYFAPRAACSETSAAAM
jgi:hypothetical protein